MKLSPLTILGKNKGECIPLIIKKKKNFLFLTNNHSSLIVYDLKKLKIKKDSSLLHPSIPISSISCSKNRTFLALGNTLHILENLIPITRFPLFQYPISSMFSKKNFLLCFSKNERKAILFDNSNLRIIARIFFPKNTSILEIDYKNQKKFKMYLGTKGGKIEIWNILSFQKICSVVFFPSFLIRFLKPNENFKKIAVGKNKKDLIILNLKQKKNSLFLKSTGKIKIEKIFLFSRNENGVFFSFEKFLFFWETTTNKITKREFLIHKGCISIQKMNVNKKFLLTLGLKDNSIALYKFKQEKNKIKLIKYQNGNLWPLRIAKKMKNFEGSLILSDSRSFFSLQTINNQNQLFFSKVTPSKDLRSGFFSKTNIFYKKKTKKLVLEQIEAIRDLSDIKKLILIFRFFHSGKLWVWKTGEKILYSIFLNRFFDPNKREKILFLVISPNRSSFLICLSNGSILSLQMPDGVLLNQTDFHCAVKGGHSICQIIGCDFDETGNFFVIGCSYGFIELWDIRLNPKKRYYIGKKILGLKWDLKSDLIMCSCEDHSLYIVFPESFSIPRVFRGHSGALNDFRTFGNSSFLATASMDCSVKIWDFSKKFCIDTLVNKYPPVSLNFDQNENCLISTHRNTTGVGIWKLNNSFRSKVFRNPLEKARNPNKRKEETISIFSDYEEEISLQIKSFGFFFQKKFNDKLFLKKDLIFEQKSFQNSENKSRKIINFSRKNFSFNQILKDETFRDFLNLHFLNHLKKSDIHFVFKKKLTNQKFYNGDFLIIQAVFLENLLEKMFSKFYLFNDIKDIFSFFHNKKVPLVFNRKNNFLFERILVELKRIDFLIESFFEKFFLINKQVFIFK